MALAKHAEEIGERYCENNNDKLLVNTTYIPFYLNNENDCCYCCCEDRPVWEVRRRVW